MYNKYFTVPTSLSLLSDSPIDEASIQLSEETTCLYTNEGENDSIVIESAFDHPYDAASQIVLAAYAVAHAVQVL